MIGNQCGHRSAGCRSPCGWNVISAWLFSWMDWMLQTTKYCATYLTYETKRLARKSWCKITATLCGH